MFWFISEKPKKVSLKNFYWLSIDCLSCTQKTPFRCCRSIMRNRRSIEHFGKSLCSGFSVIERTKGWSVKVWRPGKGFPFKHLRGPSLLWTRPKYVVSAFYIRWRFFTTCLRQPFLELYQKGLSFCCRSLLCTTKPIESIGRFCPSSDATMCIPDNRHLFAMDFKGPLNSKHHGGALHLQVWDTSHTQWLLQHTTTISVLQLL
jgi:hypothetical protein